MAARSITYSLNGKTYTTPIKTLRGDYKDANGNTANRLRRWEKHEFKPRPDDIFQERLYCIQWITADTLDKKQKETFFAAVTEEDLARERQVEQIVAENIEQWQQQGFVPDLAIEPGEETTRLQRERGWTYWHHLFKLPAVRREVEAQITQMLHLNADVKNKRNTGSLPVAALPTSLWVVGEPVFNDSDLQMAGYAAALKVLTAYTQIGDEDATTFALRPRQKGQVTVVDEIVQQASEAANSLLIPEGLQPDTWNAVKGVLRFYLRMLDIETTGASKPDNYQNFAKTFHVEDYTKLMASMAPNKARLKSIEEFTSRDLTDSTEIGPTYLGKLIIALQQLLQDKEPQTVIDYLHSDITNFLEARPLLIDMTDFIAAKTRVAKVRDVAEILVARMRNQRLA